MKKTMWDHFEGVLFDLDGVITPTASVHERAWGELFKEFDYSEQDYLTYIDGKPRYEGVASFLESRGVSLPTGDPSDAPGNSTVAAMGNRKNDIFIGIVDQEGVAPFPGSIALCDFLDSFSFPQGIVSSSRNAVPVLGGAGLSGRFTVIVDGLVAAEKQLPGKPRPDTFLYGAELLGTEVSKTVVIEDASAGVKAAKAGNFGLVVGVNRGVGRSELSEAGADLVVDDLSELLEIGPTQTTGEDNEKP